MEEEEKLKKVAALEGLLFIHGEPLAFSRIEKLLHLTSAERGEIMEFLKSHFEKEPRGVMLILDKEKVQLVTKPELTPLLQQFVKDELAEDLTPASLETMAIIAYLGPLSRSRIEYVRGVNSLFTLRNLRLRGLIERLPDPEHPREYRYQASFDTLKHLGVSKVDELPEYEKFHALLKNFETSVPPGASQE